jgi:hypothetical protein
MECLCANFKDVRTSTCNTVEVFHVIGNLLVLCSGLSATTGVAMVPVRKNEKGMKIENNIWKERNERKKERRGKIK